MLATLLYAIIGFVALALIFFAAWTVCELTDLLPPRIKGFVVGAEFAFIWAAVFYCLPILGRFVVHLITTLV